MTLHRRHFLRSTGVAFAGLAASGCARMEAGGVQPVALADTAQAFDGYGTLMPDPAGYLDLPEGFTYRVISRFGEVMDDGFMVPDAADGMGCFDLGNGQIALVRNHELKPGNDAGGIMPAGYDEVEAKGILAGGTTNIVLDAETLEVQGQFRTLAGTIRNCAGGETPWGTWLTCEEFVAAPGEHGLKKSHGYVFEVPASARGMVDAVPLTAMGKFNHEAACVDPASGIVYLTEDRGDSLLYRFIPNVPGQLARGGRLEAAAVEGIADTRNWDGVSIATGTSHPIRWIPLEDVDGPKDDLRERGAAKGATLFARGEGIWMGEGQFYFACTNGGAIKHGQIMRVRPSSTGADRLDLFFESTDPDQLNYGDNLTVGPNGHLVVCEDQYTDVVTNHLRGITPDGRAYPLAFLREQTELAGACFSPDGRTLFVNAYSPTRTLAITGPWYG